MTDKVSLKGNLCIYELIGKYWQEKYLDRQERIHICLDSDGFETQNTPDIKILARIPFEWSE